MNEMSFNLDFSESYSPKIWTLVTHQSSSNFYPRMDRQLEALQFIIVFVCYYLVRDEASRKASTRQGWETTGHTLMDDPGPGSHWWRPGQGIITSDPVNLYPANYPRACLSCCN